MIKRAIMCLLLGAIMNIAVAWGLALALHANTTNPIKQGWHIQYAVRPCKEAFGYHTHWHVRRLSRFGSSLVVVTCVGNPGPSQLQFNDLLPPVSGIRDDIAGFEAQGPNVIAQPGKLYWDGRGWPCLAMSAHWPWYTTTWPNPPIAHGIAINKPKAPGDWPWGIHDLHALPLRPLWPGFAINAVFYAAIIWLGAAAWVALRRRRRFRRGLCPKCAYPIGVSELCTECGQPLPRR